MIPPKIEITVEPITPIQRGRLWARVGVRAAWWDDTAGQITHALWHADACLIGLAVQLGDELRACVAAVQPMAMRFAIVEAIEHELRRLLHHPPRVSVAGVIDLLTTMPHAATQATLHRIEQALQDRLPRPGQAIKQYVLDQRLRAAWTTRHVPWIDVPPHLDEYDGDDGAVEIVPCDHDGPTPWCELEDAGCLTCEVIAGQHAGDLDVSAFRAALSQLPPVCADRTRLSAVTWDELDAILSGASQSLIANGRT